jgi:hypothetical protein
MSAIETGKIKQIAYLTENLDASIAHWIQHARIGPWTVYKNVVMTGTYKGATTSVKMNVGLSYRDDLQIELIEMASKTPSPYQDEAGRTLVGMHHMAWFSSDLDADLKDAARRGLTCVFDASNPASRVAYLSSAAEPGLLFEFISLTAAVQDGFTSGMAASRAWDGVTSPISVIDLGG